MKDLEKNLGSLREAGSKADFMDKAGFLDVMDDVQSEVVHLEVGASAWANRLRTEKMCGMTHTEEVNAWLAAQEKREPKA